MPTSPAAEQQIRARLEELDQLNHKIDGCQVLIEEAHHHKQKGRLFHVRIELAVPGAEIVVSRDPSEHHAHEDPYVAIRDAFDAARRQLKNHIQVSRGETKHHTHP
jgi:ribosome-associated translation inhibitor RaiA